MKVKVDNRIVECQKRADEKYIGKTLVDSGMVICERILDRFQASNRNIPVNISLYTYEQSEIQAFAIKHNKEYIVGISTGTFLDLRSWFTLWFSTPLTFENFGFEEGGKEKYIELCFEYALKFLVVHEIFHILKGHCDLPENEEKFILEQSKKNQKNNNLFCQTLEYDADCCSAAYCTHEILEDNVDDIEIKINLKLLLFSVYTILKRFSEYENYNFDEYIRCNLEEYDHPNAWIRYRYVGATILSNLDVPQEKFDYLADNLVESIPDFELNVLKTDNIKKLLIAGAHSEKATEHLLVLHNSMVKMNEKLKDYTHIDLIGVEKIETADSIFDNNGVLKK